MTRSKWFLFQGRALEIRDVRVMTCFQIWIYEDGRPLARHGEVHLSDIVAGAAAGRDTLGGAMEAALHDVESGQFSAIQAAVFAAPVAA